MTILRLATVAVLTFALSAAVSAGERLPEAALHAMSFAAGVLHVQDKDAVQALTIDAARTATLLIASTEPLEFTVRLPDGSSLTSARKATESRQWYRFDNRGNRGGDMLPGVGSRANLLLAISKPPPGHYDVTLVRTARDKNDVPYVITLLLDSDLGMALWMPSGEALRGEPFLVSAILLDAGKPAKAAQVRATLLKDPDDGVSGAIRLGEMTLHDDGKDGDYRAGDGVYTAVIVPNELGRIRLGIRATGTTEAGLGFERDLGNEILVSDPSVRIRLGPVKSSTQMAVELEGPRGRYEVTAERYAPDGTDVSKNQIVELEARANVAIVFPPALAPLKSPGVPQATTTLINVYQLTQTDKILRGRLVDRN